VQILNKNTPSGFPERASMNRIRKTMIYGLTIRLSPSVLAAEKP
jgi:hypothetical protein